MWDYPFKKICSTSCKTLLLIRKSASHLGRLSLKENLSLILWDYPFKNICHATCETIVLRKSPTWMCRLFMLRDTTWNKKTSSVLNLNQFLVYSVFINMLSLLLLLLLLLQLLLFLWVMFVYRWYCCGYTIGVNDVAGDAVGRGAVAERSAAVLYAPMFLG